MLNVEKGELALVLGHNLILKREHVLLFERDELIEMASLRVEFGVQLDEMPAEHRVAVLGALLIRLGSRFKLMDCTQVKEVQGSTGKPFADLVPMLLLELDVYWFLLYLHTHIDM